MQKLLDVKRILIINLGGLGDCLLSMPGLRLLKTSYSQARVVLLTIGRSAGLFKGFNYLDEIIIFELGFLAKLKLFLKLRNMHFDLVVNMRPLTSIASSIKMAILFFIINVPLRVGRDTENRGFFFNIKIPELDNASMHDLDYYFYMFKSLGLDSDDRDINLAVDREDSEYIDKYLAGQGVSKADILIGMNPGASWQSRRWPIENFSELISLLLKKGNFKIIITATKKEKQLVNKLKGLVDAKIIDASEETNPGQLLALIKRCNLFVSNDAGPMHLAAALHTPLIAIFGPGEFIRYDPRRLWEKAVVFY
jgi:heptosyltransferase-2